MNKYQEFVQVLQDYWDKKVSGCVFFATTDDHSGRVVLNDGEITSISYANQRGNRAMHAMATIALESFRFDQLTFASIPDVRLPDTPTILATLANAAGAELSTSAVADAPTASQTSEISAEAMTLIEDTLTDLIGPMASFLCEDHVQTASSTTEALSQLATEISPEEKQQLEQVLLKHNLI